MRRLLGLLRATHPLPATAVTGLAAIMLAALGVAPGPLIVGTLCTAAGQASVGWSNDYLDRDRDAAASRTEKPIVDGTLEPGVVRAAAIYGLLGSLAMGIGLGAVPAVTMAAAVASAWAYNLWLKRTVWSWIPYAVSFALLPAFVWSVAELRPPLWVLLGGAVLGIAAHLMNVIPDLHRDPGVRGLPHRLGATGSLVLAAIMLASALLLAVAASGAVRSPSALTVAVMAGVSLVGAVAAGRKRPRLGFVFAIASAAGVAGVILIALRR